MKRIILVLSFLLTACSQEVPVTSRPLIITESPQATLPPTVAKEVTSIPTIDLQPASALPAGPITMVALGDSLTQGDGDDTGRGYTLRLLDKVNGHTAWFHNDQFWSIRMEFRCTHQR